MPSPKASGITRMPGRLLVFLSSYAKNPRRVRSPSWYSMLSVFMSLPPWLFLEIEKFAVLALTPLLTPPPSATLGPALPPCVCHARRTQCRQWCIPLLVLASLAVASEQTYSLCESSAPHSASHTLRVRRLSFSPNLPWSTHFDGF